MRPRVQTLLTLALILPFLFAALYYLLQTISLHHLDTTVLRLSIEQVHYLLLIVVCLILLYGQTDHALQVTRIHQVFGIARPRSHALTLLRLAWLVIAVALALFGFLVPFLDLLGSMSFSVVTSPEVLAPKVTLLLLTSFYIYELFQRGPGEAKLLSEILRQAGFVSILNREQLHAFMSSALDRVPNGSDIFVTNFEEPRNPMHQAADYVFYYEDNFMRKWYEQIRAKHLRVTQIVLVNSEQDIADLERRLEVVRELPQYALAYIVAPPFTVFCDFMIVPGDFALVAFSDDRSMRNMDVFAIVMQGGPGVSRLARVFSEILVPESRFIKTFEGVNDDELDALRDQAAAIGRSSSRLLRDWFQF